MARLRRAYSPDFKDEAVKQVNDTGRSSPRVAKEIGVADPTLSRLKTYRD